MKLGENRPTNLYNSKWLSCVRCRFRCRRLPRGRIIEVYGPESSGKTTVALHAIAEVQNGGTAAFIDAEHALDPQYAQN